MAKTQKNDKNKKSKKAKKSKPKPSCGICRYFVTRTKTLGQCRAEPPHVTNATGKATWPTVRTADWCGCFRRTKP